MVNAANPGFNWDTRSNREAEGGSDKPQPKSITTPELGSDGDIDWLNTARQAAQTSESFISASLRSRWTRSYRAFQSKHSEASKYNSKRYRGRSSLYRPKTRSVVRKADAQAGAAFFATHDVVQMTAENDGNQMQLRGAKLQHELLNLRLDRANTEYGIPWFLTVIGAHQDAKITGICCTKQEWLYEEEIVGHEEVVYNDPDTGEEFTEREPTTRKTVSKPNVRLFPVEMVLRDPAADWIDQAQNSSYVILKYPMSVGDVKKRMDANNPLGQEWQLVDDSVLKSSLTNQENSSVRRARDGKELDRHDNNYTTIEDHMTIWVHENFIRHRGRDMHFWSVGTVAYLTDPVPVRDVYPEQKGRRPIIIGYGQVEAHKVDPQSHVESWQPLQQEANDIVNLRLDNVKQNMSPVTKIRRGKQVDISQVQNRSPDSVIMLNDIKDVEWDRPPDVSGSAYAEMDRINVDIDDLAGTFSGGSVQTNRQMNETVGGLNLLSASANTIGEFDIRVFTETWMEPALRQTANLIAYYETDEEILSIAGAKAGLWDQYIEGMTNLDGLLMQNAQLRVDAGMGASDPMQRLQKLRMGAEVLAVMLGPEKVASMANDEAVIEEVFGVLGYKDGKRFYDPEKIDPKMMAMQQQMKMAAEQIKQMEQKLADGQADRDNAVVLQEIKSATALLEEIMQLGREQMKADTSTQSQVLDYAKGVMGVGTARRGQDMQAQQAHAASQLQHNNQNRKPLV